jgi:hypothetical protein
MNVIRHGILSRFSKTRFKVNGILGRLKGHVDLVIMHTLHVDRPVNMSMRVMRGVRHNSSTKDWTVEPHTKAILTG